RFCPFQVFDPGQQHAGIADQGPARLQDELQVVQPAGGQRGEDRLQQFGGIGRGLVDIADAQAAAQVQVAQGDAIGRQGVDQVQQLVERVQIRRDLGYLEADVAIHADELQARMLQRLAVQLGRLADVDAELVFLHAGGNVGVGERIDIRVDAQRYRGAHAQFLGDVGQAFEFGGRLDVEALDAGGQRLADFPALLAHAGEHDAVGPGAGRQDAFEFAARDDVESCA